jgi:DNA polymerase-3 subunit alpha
VHLRLHSEYSVVDGVVRLEQVVERAAADRQGAIALTDSGNLFGAVRFYRAARQAGVKPVIGCDLWVSHPTEADQSARLLLLAQSRTGYLNLCRLVSRSWIENTCHGRGELRPEWLDAASCEGLIALSGAAEGAVGRALLAGEPGAAAQVARGLAQAFPGRFYLELQRAGRPEDEACVRASLALALELALPVVASHPVQFLDADDFRVHEARVCIAEGRTLSDPRRRSNFTAEQAFQTQAQMAVRFADIPAALANSVHIAQRCNLELELGRPRLPDYPTPAGVGLDAHCRDLAFAGLERRLNHLYPQEAAREAARPRYAERLEVELATIARMGFSGYFLIVADFINWAKGNGVPVGPGRGSGAGSLVAYSLSITDLDPLRYDLLFERFLNPERVSMPDFDIDFCQYGRDRVIDYVKQKYGAQAVAQIATFGTLGAKAVVRDAGRVLDLPYTKCDTLSKLIPHNPADPWTLDRALAEEKPFADAVAADEEAGELIALARPLEGLVRNVGMHAGGVLIAPGALTDFCPLYCAPGTDAVVSQFDKDDVEAVGLVKFDFLGLTTLSILDLTLRYLREADPASQVTLEGIALDDAPTFELFRKANTAAVFQFESRGMRDLLKRARPDRFDDLIALVSLFRPGPMDLIPDFCDRKHGTQRVHFEDPRLQPILGPTYGIMVYQEQVMQIAQVIGGYSLGGADLLRRAMGKKKADEMARQRATFVEGAVKGGLEAARAEVLFNDMEKFAGYGFNKSHAAAYALVAYHTAWFKVHHAAAFAAANLSVAMDDTDKVHDLVDDARANGLEILPPDINQCAYRFVPVDGRCVRYGLGAVKGTGEAAIESILATRAGAGPFGSLSDFCSRVDRQRVNRRVIEALVRAGAFDGIDPDRAGLIAVLGRTLEAAEHAAAHAGQEDLFGAGAGGAQPLVSLPAGHVAWSERERLANERQALGFCFSGHLFNAYAEEARRLVSTRLADLRGSRESLRLCGIVVSVRQMTGRRGRMTIMLIDDTTAQQEVVVYAEVMERRREVIREDQLVFVTGRARFDDFAQRLSVSADDVCDLAEARASGQAALTIRVPPGSDRAGLQAVLAAYRAAEGGAGGCRVVMQVANASGSADLVLPESWRVRAEEGLLEDLQRRAQLSARFRYA